MLLNLTSLILFILKMMKHSYTLIQFLVYECFLRIYLRTYFLKYILRKLLKEREIYGCKKYSLQYDSLHWKKMSNQQKSSVFFKFTYIYFYPDSFLHSTKDLRQLIKIYHNNSLCMYKMQIKEKTFKYANKTRFRPVIMVAFLSFVLCL